MIRCDAKYSIRRRESSLEKDGLFFVICRNCRFRPSMMFVVYMILRISMGYSKNVLKISQFSSQLLTQEGYCPRQRSAKACRLLSVERLDRGQFFHAQRVKMLLCRLVQQNIRSMLRFEFFLRILFSLTFALSSPCLLAVGPPLFLGSAVLLISTLTVANQRTIQYFSCLARIYCIVCCKFRGGG